ncbi:hypothetical protein [Ruegeria sp. Alg231-54]|nr:hypothetical protein [Ruegeria sp. Alg231-54]
MMMEKLARAMDYPNFKDSISEDDVVFEGACHKAWGVFGDLQPGGPYGMG